MTGHLNKLLYTRNSQTNHRLLAEQSRSTLEPAGADSLSHLAIHNMTMGLIHKLFEHVILHKEALALKAFVPVKFSWSSFD